MNFIKPGDIAPTDYVTPTIHQLDPQSMEILTHPPGLVGALTDFGAQRSMRLTRLPALAGALAAVSALSGRKYVVDGYGMRTSLGLQTMCVAESGVGKDVMFEVSSEVADASGDVFSMAHPASVAGLHNLLAEHPTLLWRVDEFGRYLEVATKQTGHDWQLLTKMMELHTSFMKTWGKRAYSDSGKNLAPVTHPLMVGLFATTPAQFLRAMDRGTVVDGLLGRMLVLRVTDKVEAKPLGSRVWVPMPDDVTKATQNVATILAPSQGGVQGIDGHRMWPVHFQPAAYDMLQPIFDDVDNRGVDELERTLWRRSFEQIIRIAGVVALGEAAMVGTAWNVQITPTTLQWAYSLVTHSIVGMMPDIKDNAADTDLERLQNAILSALKKHMAETGDTTVKKTALIKRLKGRSRSYRDVKDAIESLVESGTLLVSLKMINERGVEFITLNGE